MILERIRFFFCGYSLFGYAAFGPNSPKDLVESGNISLFTKSTVPEALEYAGYVLSTWETLRLMLFLPQMTIAGIYVSRGDLLRCRVTYKMGKQRLLTPKELKAVLFYRQERIDLTSRIDHDNP